MSGHPETAELLQALKDNFESLVLHLLGEPNRTLSSKRNLRFGSKGAMSVELAPREKRGLWFDNSAVKGGGPLQLIIHVIGLDEAGAFAWARRWLGLDGDKPEPRPRPAPEPEPEEPKGDTAAYARKLGTSPSRSPGRLQSAICASTESSQALCRPRRGSTLASRKPVRAAICPP